jgi:hypothetical protein
VIRHVLVAGISSASDEPGSGFEQLSSPNKMRNPASAAKSCVCHAIGLVSQGLSGMPWGEIPSDVWQRV